ncbi:hypothetical protein V497_05382 [Pseudogymnoascus sp. VKM F-4516 (FW-969)]|nr:hypothetical protein V497_05382 [Pseudogymnoascus sp. VKM F-4516 (FW-969)]
MKSTTIQTVQWHEHSRTKSVDLRGADSAILSRATVHNPTRHSVYNPVIMDRWVDMASRCARWLGSFHYWEALMLGGAIVHVYNLVGYSIYFYCASEPVNELSRFSVCHFNYSAQSPTTKWMSSVDLLLLAICSIPIIFDKFEQMQKARRMKERLEATAADLPHHTANKSYAKSNIHSLVVENEKLVEEQGKLAAEHEILIAEQDDLASELAMWALKVSSLVGPLSNSTAPKGNEQTGKESVELDIQKQQVLMRDLVGLTSKLSTLASRQVDFAVTMQKVRAEGDNYRMRKLVEERVGMERQKVETEKVNLHEERESLEAEKETMKAKAAKLGIEEEKLRTTTAAEYQKLADTQRTLYDDWKALYNKMKIPKNGQSPEQIARLARDFRIKTRDTFFLMNANDKRIEDVWGILDSMGCITGENWERSSWCCYWMKVVAGTFADHIVEDEMQVAKGLHSEEGLEVSECSKVGEAVQDLPMVKEVLLDEESPKVKEVLQVGDGLQ